MSSADPTHAQRPPVPAYTSQPSSSSGSTGAGGGGGPAASAASAPLGGSSSGASPVELTSILSQVQSLQADRERLMRELEAARTSMGKLQEGKREEMRQMFQNVIQKWLADSVQDENVRKEFEQGVERMVEKTNECGVWTVACQASRLHMQQLEELERLRAECDSFRSNTHGQFHDDANRKRPRDESAPAVNDFWGELKIEYA